MTYLLKTLIFVSILINSNTILPSIISSSLIKTTNGLVKIEHLSIGSTLIGYDKASLTNVLVTHISKTSTDSVVAIATDNGCIYASIDQLFYDPIAAQWISANTITTNTTFLNAQGHHCPCINVKTISVPPTDVYHVSTTAPHTFFVSEQELLTHNAGPVIVISLAWLFGEGLKFAGIALGAAAAGSYVGVQLHNKNKQSNSSFTISPQIGTYGGYNPDPNDDEDNERKFNTIPKTEFFKKIEEHYEYYKDNIYKRKKRADGIENAEYLKWDNLHNDVEAYAKNKWHMGSIDPKTLRMYKGPKHAKLKI